MFRIKLVLLILIFYCSCSDIKKQTGSNQIKTDSTRLAVVYQCPMDCENGKTYKQPGTCPVCGMDLEKKVK